MSQTKNMKEKQSLQDSHPELSLEADGWDPHLGGDMSFQYIAQPEQDPNGRSELDYQADTYMHARDGDKVKNLHS